MQQLILHLDSETPPRDQDKAASASVSIVLITSSITRDTRHAACRRCGKPRGSINPSSMLTETCPNIFVRRELRNRPTHPSRY